MYILFTGSDLKLENALKNKYDKVKNITEAKKDNADEQVSLIVMDVQTVNEPKDLISAIHADFKFHHTRIILIDEQNQISNTDYKEFEKNVNIIRTREIDEIINQIENICSKESHKSIKPNLSGTQFKIKRAFDVIVSGFALLLLSPIFFVLALVIKLDSKGPVFFISQRVGTGYKIFNLYKFRTMKVGAESMIKDMKDMNMYAQDGEKEKEIQSMFSDDNILIDDSGFVTSEQLQAEEGKDVFMKFQNDPRITKLGNFLRNSSLDELPQLINIFKGDMSIVGNRPLPVYEAERLTTDDWAMRFLAPAGLTGLWQVTKRGKGDMSKEERIQLDNQYAMNFSFFNDIKIMLKTIPAMLQKENV